MALGQRKLNTSWLGDSGAAVLPSPVATGSLFRREPFIDSLKMCGAYPTTGFCTFRMVLSLTTSQGNPMRTLYLLSESRVTGELLERLRVYVRKRTLLASFMPLRRFQSERLSHWSSSVTALRVGRLSPRR